MTKKDITIVKKAIGSYENSCIHKIASCYMNIEKSDMLLQPKTLFERIDENEGEQYVAFFKKGITGKPGQTAIELRPENTSVFDRIIDGEMNNREDLEGVFSSVRNNFQTDENYSVFLATGVHDLPGEEEVYRFLLLTIQPCKLSKPGIMYDAPKNEFNDRKKTRDLAVPQAAILYPSFDEGHVDMGKAMLFVKSAKSVDSYKELVLSLLEARIPISEEEQKEGFENIMRAGFDSDIPFKALKQVYENIAGVKAEAKLNGEEAVFSPNEIADILINNNDMEKEKESSIREAAKKYQGEYFSAENIAPKNIAIETGPALIKVDLNGIGDIKKQVIDGKVYYLVPAENSTVENMIVS